MGSAQRNDRRRGHREVGPAQPSPPTMASTKVWIGSPGPCRARNDEWAKWLGVAVGCAEAMQLWVAASSVMSLPSDSSRIYCNVSSLCYRELQRTRSGNAHMRL